MPRLFVAIDLPDQTRELLVQLAPELPIARWVPVDQIHLTLRFIGEVGPETCAAIKRALSGLHFRPFPLEVCGVGHFPPGKRPRVLWVGLAPSAALAQLQQEVELALMETGLAPDERRFSPHITLARLRESAPVLAHAVEAFELRHRELSCVPFEVTEVILYSSVLASKGATHHKEMVIPCQN